MNSNIKAFHYILQHTFTKDPPTIEFASKLQSPASTNFVRAGVHPEYEIPFFRQLDCGVGKLDHDPFTIRVRKPKCFWQSK